MPFRNRGRSIRRPLLAGAVGAVVLIATGAAVIHACDVPVFRYAIQMWPAAPYDLIVLRQGALEPSEMEAVEKLRESSAQPPFLANLRVIEVNRDDLTGDALEAVGEIWSGTGQATLPGMILRYPVGEKVQGTVWSGPLTMENAALVLDSPARREIAARLMNGEAAVWVFLESGDAEKDTAARSFLETRLKEMEKTLETPPGSDIFFSGSPVMPTPAPGNSESASEEAPDTEIRFSIVSVSRSDPAEKVLLGMLEHSESDLIELASEPMAFPIFGRGRALFALVGKGINANTVAEACAFMVGPCSCEAKYLNPGTDLMFAADWEAGIRGIPGAVQQPLVGLATMAGAVESDLEQGDFDGGDAGSADPDSGGSLVRGTDVQRVSVGAADMGELRTGTFLRKMLISMGVIFAGMIVFSVWVLRVKPRE